MLLRLRRETTMRTRALLALLTILLLSALFDPGLLEGQTEKPTLGQAVVCEELKDGGPLNQGIVFPVGDGKVVCYTAFDPVPRKTVITTGIGKMSSTPGSGWCSSPRGGRATAPSNSGRSTRDRGE
jgi:hypothetical protein